MKSSRRQIIFRIILFYIVLGAAWIITSDSIIFILFPDPDVVRSVSIYKGWAYVIITAAMLTGLLYRELKDLETAHKTIEDSEQRFRLLYQDAPVAFHSLDIKGNITQVNRLWCEMLGYSPAQVMGHPFKDFVAEVSHERFESMLNERVTSAQPGFETELELVRSDGTTILSSVSGRLVREPGTSIQNFYCTLQNVTDQRLLEIETRQQREEYRRIIDTVPAYIYYLDPQGVIMRVNQAAALERQTTADKLVGKPLKELFPQYSHLLDDGFDKILETGRPIMGNIHRVTAPDGQQIWISIDRIPYPGTNGKPAGVVAFVNEVTDRIRREQDLESLVDISTVLRGLTLREDIYRAVLQAVMRNLSVEGASVALQSRLEDGLSVVAAVGRWDRLEGRGITNSQGLSYRVTSTGQAELIQQVTEMDSIDGLPLTDNLRAVGAVPLIAEHLTLGALWVGSRSLIPEEDFRLLRAIADIAASALHRSMVNDLTQLRLRRISALHYIDMAISASFDWHVTLNVLLGQAVSMLGVDAAAILTYRPETQTLKYAAGLGFITSQIELTELKMGESLAGQVALAREIRYIPDLHAVDDLKIKRFASAGEDFTTYCAVPLVGKGQIKGVLELFNRTPFEPDSEWMDFTEMLSAQAAIAIDNAELFENLQQTNSELRQAYDSLILGWSRGLELRDAESQGHANRLVDYTLRLARRIRLPENQLLNLRRGVLLHDIGKMGVPDSILLKPGALTDEEWVIMRQHPVFAYDLLASIGGLKQAMDVPYCHHEHWDGSGYPRGLRGEDIPIAARLFSVVDIWDAVTHDRPYRDAWDKERAAAYLREVSGTLLDPHMVDDFLAILHEDGILGDK